MVGVVLQGWCVYRYFFLGHRVRLPPLPPPGCLLAEANLLSCVGSAVGASMTVPPADTLHNQCRAEAETDPSSQMFSASLMLPNLVESKGRPIGISH